MSYNYYCYGQIKNKDGKWDKFSEHPFADNLKYYIDFDDVPDCFKPIGFGKWEDDNQYVAEHFMNEFKECDGYNNAWFIHLDKFIEYYNNKILNCISRINGTFAAMGIEINDIDWRDDEVIYEIQEMNGYHDGKLDNKCIPICKKALVDILKNISEIHKYQYLLNIAHVFESMAYDSTDLDNSKKSLIIVML